MKPVAILLGLLVCLCAWGAGASAAILGLRPFVVNGQEVDAAGRQNAQLDNVLGMAVGDKALIEIFVDGVTYENADDRTGIASYDVGVAYDPAVISLTNPNTFQLPTGTSLNIGDKFKPLGLEPDNCKAARGGGCPDAAYLFDAAGRDLPFGVSSELDANAGFLRLSALSSGDAPTPRAGVIGVFAIELLGGTSLTGLGLQAQAGAPSTLLDLMPGSPTSSDVLIKGDGTGDPIAAQLGSLVINPVPLPGSALLLLSAVGVLGYRAWRRAA